VTREIVMDTETTGLSPLTGDRVVEIGGVELFNHIPTGKTFHQYINPDRQMTADAYNVHGLSDEFLRDKPRFAEIADNMLAFFGDATLIAHNAPFDVSFLNFELEKAGRPALRNPIIDTVAVARDKHPGARVSLDALCKHYGIDNSRRTLHGALLDSEILADVYLELIGGRQVALALVEEVNVNYAGATLVAHAAPQRPTPLPSRLDAETLAAHMSLIRTMGEAALWGYYRDEEAAA
jgi:DNA polymerase-3 subunit epsilon